MVLLLDTHVLSWWWLNDTKLSHSAREVLVDLMLDSLLALELMSWRGRNVAAGVAQALMLEYNVTLARLRSRHKPQVFIFELPLVELPGRQPR